MQSPRFDIRARRLKEIFSPSNIENTWKNKVRVSMRQQLVNDGVEHFDFHVHKRQESAKLSNIVLSGHYVPQKAQRILVEKSKGFCRQVVIPSVRDAIVLQCLSDALYDEIRGKAPTKKSFYLPKDHSFNAERPAGYGTFAAWLNFQKNLFKFAKKKPFIVITDIANYYDGISYVHLRNAIASITTKDECVLDMLIYVLSDLLWQPDYTPRVEIGLPQIDLDAPRLLAHCLLYELDSYLDSNPNREFVRFMDDIDIGVDSIVEAKEVIKSTDLILQTKQIRLNSGKTQILTQVEALEHFCVVENARLDVLRTRIDKRLKSGLSLARERRLIEQRVSRGLRSHSFDRGNGEKILKRWLGLAAKTGARITEGALERIIKLRPALREAALLYLTARPVTGPIVQMLWRCLNSGLFVDDAGRVHVSNYLVEMLSKNKRAINRKIILIIEEFKTITYYDLYCRIWLQSKFSTPREILETISSGHSVWTSHERLGRLVGSLRPIFKNSRQEAAYIAQITSSNNSGAIDTYRFQNRLMNDIATFDSMFPALSNPNLSRATGITHSKWLCLLSALQNAAVPKARRDKLKTQNVLAFEDAYYGAISDRLGVSR